ncbi:Eco57I restriction-modification methylase domain-containing protein, partial [Brachyspira catarrhinii]
DKIYKDVLKNFENKNASGENDAKEFSLRFLGRALFCWFLREKDLIPKEIFDSETFAQVGKNYYKEVLEELFFNVLNARMEERKITSKIIKKYEKQIPFLNGGLFSKQKDDEKVETIDSEIIKELFEFFSLYNFTVDESAPFDIEISIEPEMLGRIFENLLAEINPETSINARKETGSFYTPREIVDYMVCESIKLYLKKKVKIPSEKIENIFNIGDETKWTKEESLEILKAIHEMKILDIACGSGAFPMGVLSRVFNIIDKLDGGHEYYKDYILSDIQGAARKDFEELYNAKKFNYAYKLDMLQRMIHGVDIQPIATEISRLRAFLSLIVDEEKDDNQKSNLGIKALPNLEFNFISANSLISIKVKNNSQQSFNSMYVDGVVEKIKSISEDYFNSSSKEDKDNIKHRFNELMDFIDKNDYLEKEDKKKFSSWNPFENKSSEFFDSEIQFGIKSFDIVIGNPPYGAKIKEEEKKIYKENYKTAKTIKGVQKGSLDTYTLFIEKGFDLLGKNGNLTYIVPISFTSSDSLSGVHYLLENNCENIWVSSYAVRPQPVFQNAVVNTSVIAFEKTLTPCKNLFSTKMYRKGKNFNLSNLINNLKFIEVKDLKMFGRIPKISLPIEKSILQKIFKQKPIKDFLKEYKGKPIYYRFAGGRYYKVITNYPTNSSAEAVLYFDKKFANAIGCILSSSLSFWFYQIFSDNLNWKSFEIEQFTIPYSNFTDKNIISINNLYKEYLKDIEKNANIREVSSKSKYTMDKFKEYKIGKSKHIIDKIDRLICPLYDLTEEETEFIIGYELEFRV